MTLVCGAILLGFGTKCKKGKRCKRRHFFIFGNMFLGMNDPIF